MNFTFLKNEKKACPKFYKKNYFLNLESLCDDIQNKRLCRFLPDFLDTFSGRFYFICQIRSFYIISIFNKYIN